MKPLSDNEIKSLIGKIVDAKVDQAIGSSYSGHREKFVNTQTVVLFLRPWLQTSRLEIRMTENSDFLKNCLKKFLLLLLGRLATLEGQKVLQQKIYSKSMRDPRELFLAILIAMSLYIYFIFFSSVSHLKI